ncbi:MAG TPA: glycogen debranching N-terminal domain-containing protein [Candidatus Limnocylindrales bacterium]
MAPPGSVVVHAGDTVLRSSASGMIVDDAQGLYDFDTRILSRHRLTVAGQEPELVSSGQPESDTWWAVLTVPRSGGDARGRLLPQDALEVRLSRQLGRGLREEITVQNHSGAPWAGDMVLDLDGDFADSAEVGRGRRQVGTLDRRWEPDDRSLCIAYAAKRESRRLTRALRVPGSGGRKPSMSARSQTRRLDQAVTHALGKAGTRPGGSA